MTSPAILAHIECEYVAGRLRAQVERLKAESQERLAQWMTACEREERLAEALREVASHEKCPPGGEAACLVQSVMAARRALHKAGL